MSERTTGATTQQIEQAAFKFYRHPSLTAEEAGEIREVVQYWIKHVTHDPVERKRLAWSAERLRALAEKLGGGA